MKKTIQIILLVSLLEMSAYGYQSDLTYLDLSSYPKYCISQLIDEYCSESEFQALTTNIESGVYDGYYLHRLAVPEEDAYAGPLEITSMEVVSDASGPASVHATYIVVNPLGESVDASMTFLGALVDTIYVDNQNINSESPHEFSTTFGAGEQKSVRVEFSEELWGDIFGYNLNIFIDFKPFLTPVQEGTFTIILPQNAKIKQCLPDGYTTDSTGGRTRVTWTKKNFVPWTNPFNDLVCTWDYESVEQPISPTTTPKEEEIDWVLWSVVGLVALILLIMIFGRGKKRG